MQRPETDLAPSQIAEMVTEEEAALLQDPGVPEDVKAEIVARLKRVETEDV